MLILIQLLKMKFDTFSGVAYETFGLERVEKVFAFKERNPYFVLVDLCLACRKI